MKKKKGQAVLDIFSIGLVLVIFGITAVIMANIIKPIDTALQTDENIDNYTKNISSVGTGKFLRSMNNLGPAIIIILWLGALVSAFLIDTHPGFMVLSILLTIFLVIVTAMMANIYDDATSVLDRSDFGLVTFIIENLVMVSMVMVTSVIILLYSRLRGGAGV